MDKQLILVLAIVLTIATAAYPRHNLGFSTHLNNLHRSSTSASTDSTNPNVLNCTLNWFNQTVDHFNWDMPSGGVRTFMQRYYVCDQYWKRGSTPGPIFFYSGNEADVTLYVNNTGLMWESAPMFGALLVFAEHRYYGLSQPFGSQSYKHMSYLTSEQALADYATLIFAMRKDLNAEKVAVITFGGSYGGMLSSWLRMKYPSAVDGAIAASAPIMAFLGQEPSPDIDSFSRIVTRDARPEAGSNANCASNVRKAWPIIFSYAQTASGRSQLQSTFKLCNPPSALARGLDVAEWAESAFANMAMGNYPYPSSYITNGDGLLPAFPVRVACNSLGMNNPSDAQLLSGLASAVSVYYNVTGQMSCYNLDGSANNATDQVDNNWSYQYCTEMFMPSGSNGVTDMFWSQPWNTSQAMSGCELEWGVRPRPLWATIEYNGWRISSASNIVFSNGLYDPWSGTGVRHNVSSSVVAVLIPEGAHHLDLMFSNPQDPQSVIDARNFERSFISQWIDEVANRHA